MRIGIGAAGSADEKPIGVVELILVGDGPIGSGVGNRRMVHAVPFVDQQPHGTVRPAHEQVRQPIVVVVGDEHAGGFEANVEQRCGAECPVAESRKERTLLGDNVEVAVEVHVGNGEACALLVGGSP